MPLSLALTAEQIGRQTLAQEAAEKQVLKANGRQDLGLPNIDIGEVTRL